MSGEGQAATPGQAAHRAFVEARFPHRDRADLAWQEMGDNPERPRDAWEAAAQAAIAAAAPAGQAAPPLTVTRCGYALAALREIWNDGMPLDDDPQSIARKALDSDKAIREAGHPLLCEACQLTWHAGKPCPACGAETCSLCTWCDKCTDRPTGRSVAAAAPAARDDAPTADLGRVAYEAYVQASDGVSLVSGQPLPAWDDLAENIRMAWRMSAGAVWITIDQQAAAAPAPAAPSLPSLVGAWREAAREIEDGPIGGPYNAGKVNGLRECAAQLAAREPQPQAAPGALAEYLAYHAEFMDELLLNCGDEPDESETAEDLAIRYVRSLEAECNEQPQPAPELAAAMAALAELVGEFGLGGSHYTASISREHHARLRTLLEGK